jgi:hypothetical protein
VQYNESYNMLEIKTAIRMEHKLIYGTSGDQPADHDSAIHLAAHSLAPHLITYSSYNTSTEWVFSHWCRQAVA